MRIDFFFWSKILGAIIVLSIGVLSAINGKVSISLVMVLMVAYSVSVFSLYLMMKGNKKGRIIYTVFLGVGILNSLGVSPENFKLIAFASALLSMVCITIFHTKKMNLYFERAKTNRFEFFNGLMING